jgi:iron complex outermembrane recepter protein
MSAAIKQGTAIRRALKLTSSAFVLYSAVVASQNAFAAQTAEPAVEEVIVTGSRIVRDGYEAPTPLTVVGVEQIQDSGKQNIADTLNLMPVFQGSSTPATTGTGNGGTSGGNNLNLRALGANRTLVLFDGRRVPPSSADSSVDTNLLPDALIQRVDVVTGGASAIYGSDALTGVVNFVLDTDFTGVKGSVQSGVTQQGDGRQYKVGMSAGTAFANDRGHFLIDANHDFQDAIDGTERQWNMNGWYYIQNPKRTATNGLPQLILTDRVGLSGGYPGGIIYSGALKGIAFGVNGVPFNYNYGDYTSGQYHVGGDWQKSSEMGAQSIMIGSHSTHLFSRVSYDITDDVELFFQFNNGNVHTNARCCYNYYLTGNLTAKSGNPFIPASVQAEMTARNLATIPMAMTNRDTPHGFGMINDRMSFVYTGGAKGKFDAADIGWTWDVYAQRGITKQSFWVPYQADKDKFAMAIDAVRSPNGSIVCRSTLTNPTNGCVAYNIFGIGAASQSAFEYSFDGPRLSQTIGQNVYGGNITGEPFSTWAGPVSVAVSGEFRKDTIKGFNDPVSAVLGWFSTQMTGFNASQTVKEGAFETLVPLAKDLPWVRSLDLSVAARATDYSVAGFVSTWKTGLSYTPIDEVRFRLTQSRDIRAPNLQDLFSPPVVNHNTIPNPFLANNQSVPYSQISKGNGDLKPEKADTTGLGIIYQPQWLSGFSMSIDYYRIMNNGAVAAPSYAYVLAQCFAGVQQYCTQVQNRTSTGQGGAPELIIITFAQNQNSVLAKGVDYELSYRTALADVIPSLNGDLGLRLVATNVLNRITDSGIAGPTQILDAAGVGSSPRWGLNAAASYSLDPIRFTWTTRFTSRSRAQSTLLQCTSACPTVSGFQTVDNNEVPSYFLNNMSLTYRFYQEGTDNAEAFFNVDNVFDKDPPMAPNQVAGATYGLTTNAAMYDTLGRRFRAGIRFKM